MSDLSPNPRAQSRGRSQVSLSQAICVYAEPLVSGRRVLVLADSSLGLGERLLEVGARTVHVYDPDPNRAGGVTSTRGLVVQALPAAEFDVRDGAFDVAIVPDISALAYGGREALLARLRRLLARGGAALIGAPSDDDTSPEGLDYYGLYDLASLQFAHVRMIAEVPFGGVALADLGLEGETPEVSVDTQLAAEDEAPTRYFALASQEDVRLSEYAIIKLPSAISERRDASDSSRAAAEREQVSARADADAVHAALAQAQLRATVLEAQVDELKARVAQKSESADSVRRVAELDARLAEESARLHDAELRAKEHYARAERFSNEAREKARELSREHDRATALEGALVVAETAVLALRAQIVELEARLLSREAELQEALTDVDRARSVVASVGEAELARVESAEARAQAIALEVGRVSELHAAELAELERALRERAQIVLDLEREVARRERIVRELLLSLEDSNREAGEPARSEAGNDAAAIARDRDLARMELSTLRRDLEARDASIRAAGERAAALATTNDELRMQLDQLAMEMARREGEKQEVAWRVAELEHQIGRLEAEQTELVLTIPPSPLDGPNGPSGARGGGKVEPVRAPAAESTSGLAAQRVVELQAELDILRQAMAQEHDARLRAESGEELAKARAELARQAALLEQLSKELDARDRARVAESAKEATPNEA